MTDTHRRFEAGDQDLSSRESGGESVAEAVKALSSHDLILALLAEEDISLSDLNDAQLARLEELGKNAGKVRSKRSTDAWKREEEKNKQAFISRIGSAKLVPYVEGESPERLQPNEVMVSVKNEKPGKARIAKGPFYEVTIAFPVPPLKERTAEGYRKHNEAIQNNIIHFDVSLEPGNEQALDMPPCTWAEMPSNLQAEIRRQVQLLQ